MISKHDIVLLLLLSMISGRQYAQVPVLGIAGVWTICITYGYSKGKRIGEYWYDTQDQKNSKQQQVARMNQWYSKYQENQLQALSEQQNALQQEHLHQTAVQNDLLSVLGYSFTGFMAHGLHGYYKRIKHMDRVEYPTMRQRIKNLNLETFSPLHPIQSLKGNKSYAVPIVGPFIAANLAAMTYFGLTDYTYETWKNKQQE